MLMKRYRQPLAYVAADTSTASPALKAHLNFRHFLARKQGGVYDKAPIELSKELRCVYALLAQAELDTVILDDYCNDYAQISQWIAARTKPVTLVVAGNDIARRARDLRTSGGSFEGGSRGRRFRPELNPQRSRHRRTWRAHESRISQNHRDIGLRQPDIVRAQR